MIDISFLLNDPDFTATFEVLQPTVQFIEGEYVAGAPVVTAMSGTVRPTSDKDLEMLPEGDRVQGSTTFLVKGSVTLNINDDLAPLIRYKGLTYKVMHVMDYGTSGFTKILAVLQGRGG